MVVKVVHEIVDVEMFEVIRLRLGLIELWWCLLLIVV